MRQTDYFNGCASLDEARKTNYFTETVKKTKTTTIPSGTKFLSEVFGELPKNCLFNKGRIGGGKRPLL